MPTLNSLPRKEIHTIMMPTTTRRVATLVAAAATLVTAVAGSAGADPRQLDAYIGVGSDTTQEVVNAFAGSTNGNYYTPVHSNAGKQIISFDALPTGSDFCITTKIGGSSFYRPNGSTNGRKALSRAMDGTGWGVASGACGGNVNVSGSIHFARSSDGPAAGDTGTALTYIPFGRDGVSFAYYRKAGSPVTELTRAQLTAIFTSNTRQVINGVRMLPCGIQTGSGTFKFWNGVTTATTSTEDAATKECNDLLGLNNRAEENNGDHLKARGDAADTAVPGTQVIIGFSAASFIAKSNLVSPGTPPAGVGIGSISDNGGGINLGSPVTGTAPNLVPNGAFYNDATFGRNVYNVLPTNIIAAPVGQLDIKQIFSGATSSICQNVDVIHKFGFQDTPSCGSLSLKGSPLAP